MFSSGDDNDTFRKAASTSDGQTDRQTDRRTDGRTDGRTALTPPTIVVVVGYRCAPLCCRPVNFVNGDCHETKRDGETVDRDRERHAGRDFIKRRHKAFARMSLRLGYMVTLRCATIRYDPQLRT